MTRTFYGTFSALNFHLQLALFRRSFYLLSGTNAETPDEIAIHSSSSAPAFHGILPLPCSRRTGIPFSQRGASRFAWSEVAGHAADSLGQYGFVSSSFA